MDDPINCHPGRKKLLLKLSLGLFEEFLVTQYLVLCKK
jgi:hypothetical protein